MERVVTDFGLNGYTWLCLTVLFSMFNPLLVTLGLEYSVWNVIDPMWTTWNYILFGLNTVALLTMLIGYNLMYKALGSNDGQWILTYIGNILPYVGMGNTVIQIVRFLAQFIGAIEAGKSAT